MKPEQLTDFEKLILTSALQLLTDASRIEDENNAMTGRVSIFAPGYFQTVADEITAKLNLPPAPTDPAHRAKFPLGAATIAEAIQAFGEYNHNADGSRFCADMEIGPIDASYGAEKFRTFQRDGLAYFGSLGTDFKIRLAKAVLNHKLSKEA